ncbi:MAG: hypothetical protein ACKOEE_15390 [Tagaea sp.]|jgi:hypothetical protein|nr:hypothetical protein [Azospirillum sp.]MCA3264476.1 hypothetical protein [Azospirillum sp.]MCZ8124503.1 hypothetical protein [Magnetospirillum sp.]
MWDLRYDEPRLDEMLGDPVVRAVMARDRVSREELLACVERARGRLAPPASVARLQSRKPGAS